MMNVEKVEIIKEKIKEVLDDRDWNYEYIEELNCFHFGVRIDGVIRRLDYVIAIQDDFFIVTAGLSIGVDKTEKELMQAMMEFLHRANYGMKRGNFEFDTTTGDIRFKTYVDCEDIVPSSAMLENNIDIPAETMEFYGEGIIGIIFGRYSAMEAFDITEGEIGRKRREKKLAEEMEKVKKELKELVEKKKVELMSEESKKVLGTLFNETEDVDALLDLEMEGVRELFETPTIELGEIPERVSREIYEEFPEWDIYQETNTED